MKTFKLILVLAISIMAFSCGSDDDNTPAGPTLTNELLAGTYNLNFFNTTDVVVTTVPGGTVTTTITEVGDTFGGSNVTFNANGPFTSSFQFRITETTTLQGNDPVVETYIISDSNSGSYTVNDANQTITIDGELNDVTLFNATDLRLQYNENGVDGDESYTYTEELRFTR